MPGKSTLHLAEVNWRLDNFFVFNNIVILKCMKDFIFCKITAIYFKFKKTNTVIASNSWTL